MFLKQMALSLLILGAAGVFFVFLSSDGTEIDLISQLNKSSVSQLSEQAKGNRVRLHDEKKGHFQSAKNTVAIKVQAEREEQERRAQSNAFKKESRVKFEKLSNTSEFHREIDSLTAMGPSGVSPEIETGPEGNIRLVSGELYLGVNPKNLSEISSASLALIAEHSTIFGIGTNERPELFSIKNVDETNQIARITTRYHGLPVWGKEYAIAISDGLVKTVAGQFTAINSELDLSYKLSDSDLNEITTSYIKEHGPLLRIIAITNQKEGVLLQGNMPIHAFRLEVETNARKSWVLHISPSTKKVIKALPQFFTLSTPSSGRDLLGNTISFSSTATGNLYRMKDSSFPNNVYAIVNDISETNCDADGVGGEHAPKAVTSSNPNSGWEQAAVSAIANVKKTHDYYLSVHGRNSYDNQGAKLISEVNYPCNDYADNAWWWRNTMGYGIGRVNNNWAISLDVAGHEMTHGVIQHSSNLEYQDESGALNESFADIFGVMIERENWIIGERLNNDGTYFRSLANPKLKNDPGHMTDFLYTENDYGGVHTNSGISNRAFYLLAQGLTDEGLGTSIGLVKAEKLAYQTMIGLTQFSEFYDAAILMQSKASALYGMDSAEFTAVTKAWEQVGVLVEESVVSDSSDSVETFSLNAGDDLVVYLYPRDGTMDDLFDEEYDIYVDTVNLPFAGRVSSGSYGPINDVPVKFQKPSISTRASGFARVSYIGTDNYAYSSFLFDGYEDIKVEISDVNNETYSADGRMIATNYNSSSVWGQKKISVWDSQNATLTFFEILGPDYSQGSFRSSVEMVDAIHWDPTGTELIFDYLTCRPVPDAECEKFWSIGILNIKTGRVRYPFPNANSLIDIGFPAFSKTRKDVIIFDYHNWEETNDKGQAQSWVLIYNLSDKSYRYSSRTNMTENEDDEELIDSAWGIPSFIGADDGFVMQAQTAKTTYSYLVNLDQDYETVADEESSIYKILAPFNMGAPVAHRNAHSNYAAELSTDADSSGVGTIVAGKILSKRASVSNYGRRSIDITNVIFSSSSISTNLTPRKLVPDESLEITLTLDSSDLDVGNFSEYVELKHTGDNGALFLAIDGIIDIDTDFDGIGNSADADDDGDGVADTSDAFPLDSNESVDTDEDGIGNNGDSDDDNDGFTDEEELADGTDPLSRFSCRTGCFSFDVDGSLEAKPLTDGLLVIRHLYGFNGDSLTSGAMPVGASRNTSDAITSYLTDVHSQLDIDGDGQSKPLTDGLLLIRYLFGFSGDSLISGAIGSGAERNTAEAIEAYIAERLPR